MGYGNNMGYGSGKGGKKSSWGKGSGSSDQTWKGSSWDQSEMAWNKGSWNSEAEKGWGKGKGTKWSGGGDGAAAEEDAYIGRLQVQYQFTKASLRAYSDSTGSALYTSDNVKFVSPTSLVKHLSGSNSNMVRNPATGLSCAASSILSMSDVLRNLKSAPDASGMTALSTSFESVEGVEFLAALRVINFDGIQPAPAEAQLTAALKTVSTFIESNRDALPEALGRLAIASSRLYLGSMSALETMTMMMHKGEWASKVPASEATAGWKSKPNSEAKCLQSLKLLLQEKAKKMAEYSGKGNRAEDVFLQNWGSGAQAPAAASRESSDEDAKEKKKSEKKTKKSKKAKKSTTSSSSSSPEESNSTDEEEQKKKKKQKKSKKMVTKKYKRSSIAEDEDKKAAPKKKAKTSRMNAGDGNEEGRPASAAEDGEQQKVEHVEKAPSKEGQDEKEKAGNGEQQEDFQHAATKDGEDDKSAASTAEAAAKRGDDDDEQE